MSLTAAGPAPAPPPNPGSPALQFALSGASVAVANTCTIPLDVLKVRMQLAAAAAQQAAGAGGGGGGGGRGRPRPPGLAATAARLASTEGPAAFFSGLGPALARGLFYGGARLGLYGPAKSALAAAAAGRDGGGGGGAPPAAPVALAVAAGGLSGVGAALLTSPLDLCKTRLQAPRPAGVPRPTAAQVVRGVMAVGGVGGLWAGCGPAAARAAVQTAAQCAAYDGAKASIGRASGWGPDSPATHLAASAVTGAVVTTTTAPIDLVKTRMMVAAAEAAAAAAAAAAPPAAGGGGGRAGARAAAAPPGALRTAAAIVRAEGPAALMRGWTVQYVRLGPQSVVTFVVLERLRAAAGLSGF